MNDGTPVWFITGCSTGLGRALAATAVERGHRVAATARDPHTLAEAVKRAEACAPAGPAMS
ncbi:SDR family NAD(P)-dependent oxidoreductase [Streptomyces sp. RG80]|uniref:SDR family NAD(P)-dependent oxidoreductase n=1 Tax=Streptomyces sp. RG80 TaxID=3157340 RepID=UPI00338D960B